MQQFSLVGLGNPGPKYAATRHNAGRMFIRWMKEVKKGEIEVTETKCFMNNSGKFVYNFYKNYNHYKEHKDYKNYSHLLIAHDDLDLPLGQYKIQFGKGPHGHKGLNSIYQALGTKKFWHVRIGIDNRNGCHCEPRCGAGQSSASDTNIPIAPSGLDSSPAKGGIRMTGEKDLRMTAKRESGEIYTLKPFGREEKKILEKVFAAIARQIELSFRA